MADEVDPLYIINGSCQIKANWISSSKGPRVHYPSVVGRLKSPLQGAAHYPKDFYVGDEAYSRRGVLDFEYPIQDGIIVNFDSMEKMWHHTFWSELRVEPGDHPVLLTERVWNPREAREKTTQIMFEKFNLPAMYLMTEEALAMIGSCNKTGVVVSIGDSSTSVVSIYEGAPLRDTLKRTPLGSKHITEYLSRLLAEKGVTLPQPVVRDLMERMTYVALDFGKEAPVEKSWELPDGNVILVGDERFRCPEAFFNPSLVGVEGAGIVQLVHQSIRRAPADEPPVKLPTSDSASLFNTLPSEIVDQVSSYLPRPSKLQQELYGCIVLEGGGCSTERMGERMESEFSASKPAETKRVRVVGGYQAKHNVWIGCSMMETFLPCKTDTWITKEDYDETGPAIVHRKCWYY